MTFAGIVLGLAAIIVGQTIAKDRRERMLAGAAVVVAVLAGAALIIGSGRAG